MEATDQERRDYPNTVAVPNYEQVVADQQPADWLPRVIHEEVKNFL